MRIHSEEDWAKIRTLGRERYLLRYGVIGRGLPMGIVVALLIELWDPSGAMPDALLELRDDPEGERRVGLELSGRRVPREGCPVLAAGAPVGEVTSGTFSPTFQRPLAMAYVHPGSAEVDSEVEVVNPDLHIATLTKNAPLEIEMEVARGRGYVPAERNKKEEQAIGVIPVDSIFTPVKKVNFYVENTRVGQITDYDKLILEIWTNGAIDPKESLLYASNIMQRHLDIFVGFGKLPEEEEVMEETTEQKQLKEKLKIPISELELSVRSSNCLREGRIKTIGDLVKRSELEMLKYRNFGKKSLGEINKILGGMGLSLGMKLDEEPNKKEESE